MAIKQAVHFCDLWSENPEHFDCYVDLYSFMYKEWAVLV